MNSTMTDSPPNPVSQLRDDVVLTPQETANILKVSLDSVYDMRRRGAIQGIYFGSLLRFRSTEVARLCRVGFDPGCRKHSRENTAAVNVTEATD